MVVFIIILAGVYSWSESTIEVNTDRVNSIPVKPYKFSIGDRIRLKGNTLDDVGHYIVDIREGYYWCDADITIPHSYQDRYETF